MTVRRADPPPRNVVGGLWVLASAGCFVVSMSLVKFLGNDLPAPMQAFVRQAFGLVILLPWILHNPLGAFRTTRPGLFLSRGLATSASMVISYYSYQELPLAEANALSFTRTLWVVPLAMVMLGEWVPRARLLATVVGFGGVLLILNPGAHQAIPFRPAAAGLVSAMLLAFSLTGIKVLARTHGQLPLMAWAAVLGTLFTLPTAVLSWRMPDAHDCVLLGVMSLAGISSQYCYTRGLAVAEATVIAPIDYSRIAFSVAIGFVVFREVPPLATWAGVAVIVGTTLFITWHAGRSRTPAPA